jgi:hypothetical protein
MVRPEQVMKQPSVSSKKAVTEGTKAHQKMALSLTQQLEIYCLTTSYRVSEVL